MHRRRVSIRGVLAAVVLLASVLAGCTSPTGSGSVEAIPATEAVERAERNATRWQPDAELVLASGVEAPEGAKSTREVPDEGGRSQPAAPVDPSVGDGRAPRWTVMFHSSSANASRTYQVTGDAVEDQGPTRAPSSRPRLVRNWTVDSTDAVGTALGNASFREAALATDGEVVQTLGMRGEAPAWRVLARSASKGLHVPVLVDASSGEVVSGENGGG